MGSPLRLKYNPDSQNATGSVLGWGFLHSFIDRMCFVCLPFVYDKTVSHKLNIILDIAAFDHIILICWCVTQIKKT